ncbi:unnamed protein product [Diamesa serratosioi]
MSLMNLNGSIENIQEEAVEMRVKKRDTTNMLMAKEKLEVTSSKRDSFISMKHYDHLLNDLRCPGCTAPLIVPIYLCESGHSVCKYCRFSIKTCPLCQEGFTNIRSHTLERLSEKFQFPCRNMRNGCTVRLPLELMHWHDNKCIFKTTSCFMGKVWRDCRWKGRESDWLDHCKSVHTTKILENQERFPMNWNFETIKNKGGPIVAYYLIQMFNETFNLYQIHEVKTSSMVWTVILANYKEQRKSNNNVELPKFAFEIELFNPNDSRNLQIQRFPIHYEDSETILDDGKCVKISLNEIENRFLDENKDLFYFIKIVPWNNTDRWDELLGKAIAGQITEASTENDFLDFENEDIDEKIIIDDNKIADVANEKENSVDLLKQIYDKEFNHQDLPLIKKPPRKSLDIANHKTVANGSYSSFNSLPYD